MVAGGAPEGEAGSGKGESAVVDFASPGGGLRSGLATPVSWGSPAVVDVSPISVVGLLRPGSISRSLGELFRGVAWSGECSASAAVANSGSAPSKGNPVFGGAAGAMESSGGGPLEWGLMEAFGAFLSRSLGVRPPIGDWRGWDSVVLVRPGVRGWGVAVSASAVLFLGAKKLLMEGALVPELLVLPVSLAASGVTLCRRALTFLAEARGAFLGGMMDGMEKISR